MDPTPRKEDPKKDEFKLPEIKIGDEVVHKAFGEGKVVEFDVNTGHIKIKFKDIEKTFGVRFAFEKGFLTLKK